MRKSLIFFSFLLISSVFSFSKAEATETTGISSEIIEESLKPSYGVPFLPSPFYNVENWINVLITDDTKKDTLSGKRIVLDAGHGGKDGGASANGVKEKDINLPVTLKTAEALRELGAEVYLTRDKDITLQRKERYLLANQTGAMIFISIHANSGSPDVNGLETFYYREQDKALGTSLQSHLIQETNSKNRETRFGDYYVLRENSVPSALIEIGFLTSQEDLAKLTDDVFYGYIAKGIANGVVDYFN